MNPISGFYSYPSLDSVVGGVALQPNGVEQLITLAWQWLVLVAAIAWTGSLAAEYTLLAASRGEQRAQIKAILHLATRRQLRQSWLWLSIILVGTAALFWLRVTQVLPQQPLNALPHWPLLAHFVFSTVEGWLWFARGGLVSLALLLLACSSLLAWRRARVRRQIGFLIHREIPPRSLEEPGAGLEEDAEEISARIARSRHVRMRRSSLNTASQIADIHLSESWLPEALWGTRLHLVLAAGLLLTFVLAGPEMQGAWLPLTTISLHWVALLALSIWLGRVLYLACVLAPVTHVIESGERTQTIIEFLPTIKPPIVQALLALALYEIFLAETQVTRSIIFSDFLTHPFGWVLMAEVGLAGLLILLAVYQQRFVLPHLARMTWLAVRGTVMSVRGGMDVSRALQISQNERLALADLASRRLIQTLYAQIALGLLLLLGLMLTSLLVFPLAG